MSTVSPACAPYLYHLESPPTPVSLPIQSIITNRTQISRRKSHRNPANLTPIQTLKRPPNTHLVSKNTHSGSLNMALLNVRSLLNQSFLINDLILDNSIDCMFLTETWLSTDAPITLIEASPQNYMFTHMARKGRKGGGIASILSSSVGFKDISFEEYSSFEYLTIVFSSPPVLGVTVYRPPGRCSSFISDFSELLSIIHNQYERIVILGDFNLHIDNQSDSFPQDFLNLLNCMNFTQHVRVPTHNKGHTLDLVITYGLSANITSVVDLGISDHFCLVSFLRSKVL